MNIRAIFALLTTVNAFLLESGTTDGPATLKQFEDRLLVSRISCVYFPWCATRSLWNFYYTCTESSKKGIPRWCGITNVLVSVEKNIQRSFKHAQMARTDGCYLRCFHIMARTDGSNWWLLFTLLPYKIFSSADADDCDDKLLNQEKFSPHWYVAERNTGHCFISVMTRLWCSMLKHSGVTSISLAKSL